MCFFKKKKKLAYFVSWEPGRGTIHKSIDSILKAYPQMSKKGIDNVLSGKQKTHVGYRITKVEVTK